MKKLYTKIQLGIIILIFSAYCESLSGGNYSQDDPVLCSEVAILPGIDGNGDDPCWQNIPWQAIDNVWIPYQGNVGVSDYTGHYKIAWSSSTNLLYFLVEVNDDVFVDGFQSGVTSDIYNFDIAEVFIDENNSGGEHRYDANNSNAENAFAYHMYAAFPSDGELTTEVFVDDMAGTNSNSWRPDYSSHFPDFSLSKTGNTAVWEFSLVVYNDTYINNNKEASRTLLSEGKEMGLSIAYCDNDNPNENPKQRDNMFGSVSEPSPGNLHWMNADHFGTVKLISAPTSVADSKNAAPLNSITVYPNPSSVSSNLLLENDYRGDLVIKLYNVLGQEIFSQHGQKNSQQFSYNFKRDDLPNGLYFLNVQSGKTAYTQKILFVGK